MTVKGTELLVTPDKLAVITSSPTAKPSITCPITIVLFPDRNSTSLLTFLTESSLKYPKAENSKELPIGTVILEVPVFIEDDGAI